MAEFPHMPLFIDAYMSDAGHLTDAEHGRYFLLLMTMWKCPECRIPNDDEWLARRFRRSPEMVKQELRPIISEFMTSTGNWITQKRLRKEWEWCRDRSISQSVRAKSRWEKEKGVCQRNAPIPIKKERKKDAASAPSGGATNPPLIPPVDPDSDRGGKQLTAEQEYFHRVRDVLGRNGGGMGARLLRAKGGNIALARAALELASTKFNPREYVAATIKRDGAASMDGWGEAPGATVDQW